MRNIALSNHCKSLRELEVDSDRRKVSKLSRAIVMCLGFGLLPACGLADNPFANLYLADQAVVPTKDDNYPQDSNKAPPPIILDVYAFPGEKEKDENQKKISAYERAFVMAQRAAEDPTDLGKERAAMNLRNNLQLVIQERSDELCGIHRAAILANAATINAALGWTAAVLSGVSAALGGEAAKTALSTAAAIVNAGQAHINAEFYQNLLAAAIVKEIDKMRRIELNEMGERRKQDVIAYPVQEALVDVSKYHLRCAFFQGLVALTEEGARRKILTRSQIDAEIKRLEKENEALEMKSKDKKTRGSFRAAADRSLQLNYIRIEQLRQMRPTAPGTVVPETKAKPVEDLSKKLALAKTAYDEKKKLAAESEGKLKMALAAVQPAEAAWTAANDQANRAKAAYDAAINTNASDVAAKKGTYDAKKKDADTKKAVFDKKQADVDKLKAEVKAANAKEMTAKAQYKAAAFAKKAAAIAANAAAEADLDAANKAAAEAAGNP